MARKPITVEVAKDPPVIPAKTIVTNIITGSTLWLADGRKLGFGETAEVGEHEAAYLIERGQAE